MPGSIERCASPEQMPHLEPLSEPISEVNSLHDLSTIPPSQPPLEALHGSIAPKQTRYRDVGKLMRDVTAPLKLSLVVENKGSVARDHLASERTFLAYVRTSLACASAGVALVQLLTLSATGNVSIQKSGFDLNKFAKPLGATIILFGLIILVLGVVRYFTTQSALVRGYFPVARNSITMVAFILGALVGVAFGIIVAGTQG
ncbi:hypothetical protein J3R83DRAFT_13254 [Lanmaoa asiatica]|nr:hypothetical protein J3R83DRAFT_13254 [Lanmaoa asiatica]